MAKIAQHLAFVKEQVVVQERLAQKYEEDYRRALHFKTANQFAELARFLEEIQKRGTVHTGYINRGDAPQKRLFLTFEDVDSAPDELLKELNLSDTDRQELLIEYLIAEHGGVLSLDKIMIELYNRTKEVPRRATITSRLYRMAGRGMIYNVPGKKGVYSTYELSEQEVKKMFGQFDEAAEETSPAPVTSPPPRTQVSLPPGEGRAPSTDRNQLKSKLLGSAANSLADRI
jgi:Fe2+ or Zn2+ uptake regulation protein